MYRDYEDPWGQTTKEEWASEKLIALNLIQKYNAKRVIELGCGLGYYTKKISDCGVDVLGVDISETAISKASTMYNLMLRINKIFCYYHPKQIKGMIWHRDTELH
jgi:2-polyprenyl-3-methyl-5-hydroxy-6-metoxy-1,4-benzoquinol methylase